jgi:hypothetical protein
VGRFVDVVDEGQKRRFECAFTVSAIAPIATESLHCGAALVETGGMVERGRLEALRECMMSGVTVPPWRARFYLASRKVAEQVNCIVSSMH